MLSHRSFSKLNVLCEYNAILDLQSIPYQKSLGIMQSASLYTALYMKARIGFVKLFYKSHLSRIMAELGFEIYYSTSYH